MKRNFENNWSRAEIKSQLNAQYIWMYRTRYLFANTQY